MNDKDDIPVEVKALIGRHIDSVVQLELLLLFQRDPANIWTAADAARELRIEPAWTAAQLDQLASRGLLRGIENQGEAYRFAPESPEVGTAVNRLAQLYADRRVSIIALIYSKPTDSLRTFADAFRLRKDGKDG